MKWQKTLLLLFPVLVLVTTGCSPLRLLNALVPNDGFTAATAIAYGDVERQKLDLYLPSDDGGQPDGTRWPNGRPMVVFFYGGSWDSGERGHYKFVAEALTSQGFVVVVPDYRVYPEVAFPEIMQDPARVVKWAKEHAAEYGADPERLFLGGHSAGAHLAAMLLLDPRFLASQGLKPRDLGGMFGLAGPYDFLPLESERLRSLFGPEEERWKSQPINFVTGENPPMLLLVGTEDTTVLPRNTYNLANEIEAAGGPVEVKAFPEYGHVNMVLKLAKPLRDESMLEAITDFMRRNP